MLEILLDAARVFLSKDARDTAKQLASSIAAAPQWKSEVFTLEAKVSRDAFEQVALIQDLVVTRLQDARYKTETVHDFGIVFRELANNVLEHNAGFRDPLRIVLELSPSYVAVAFHNPRGSPVDVAKWIDSAAAHLIETSQHDRGRGLIICARKADVLEQVDETGVKAVFYKTPVRIDVFDVADAKLVVVMSGHANPSLGKRLERALEAFRGGNDVVLCLDPLELLEGETFQWLVKNGVSLSGLPDALRAEAQAQRGEGQFSDSRAYRFAVKSLHGYATARGGESRMNVRLVCSDRDVYDLLPQDIVSNSIRRALSDLRGRR